MSTQGANNSTTSKEYQFQALLGSDLLPINQSNLTKYISPNKFSSRSFFVWRKRGTALYSKSTHTLKLLIKDILWSSSISEDDIETGFSNSKFLLFSRACFANLNLDSGGVAIIIPSISGDLIKSSHSWKKSKPVSFSNIDFCFFS